MRLDITPVLAGKVRTLPFSFEIAVDGENAPMPPVGVTPASPVRVTGRITDSGSCLHLTLEAEVDYKALCDRCADEFTGTVKIALERMVAESSVVDDEHADDYFIAVDGSLDLDSDIAEELMLAFPTRLLCREDCRGICPDCGANLNRIECDCASKRERQIDPRWQALSAMLNSGGADEGGTDGDDADGDDADGDGKNG